MGKQRAQCHSLIEHNPEELQLFTVGDILTLYVARKDNFAVWEVTALISGGENQEDVAALRRLDVEPSHANAEGESLVPTIMLQTLLAKQKATQ